MRISEYVIYVEHECGTDIGFSLWSLGSNAR